MTMQDRISPYTSCQYDIKLTRYQADIGWSNSKFSKLTSHKLYGLQQGEWLMKSWGLKGLFLYDNAEMFFDLFT